MYTNPGDPFANAEPRLRGNDIVPRRFIQNQIMIYVVPFYTGPVAGGINNFSLQALKALIYS